MAETGNFQLNQWEKTDRIQMEDFNADNAKTDQALAGLAEQAKALGNCKLLHYSYIGTGTAGEEYPSSFTFPQVPLISMIFGPSGNHMILIPGASSTATFMGNAAYYCKTTWDGATVTWFHSGGSSSYQMNGLNVTYVMLALFEPF